MLKVIKVAIFYSLKNCNRANPFNVYKFPRRVNNRSPHIRNLIKLNSPPPHPQGPLCRWCHFSSGQTAPSNSHLRQQEAVQTVPGRYPDIPPPKCCYWWLLARTMATANCTHFLP